LVILSFFFIGWAAWLHYEALGPVVLGSIRVWPLWMGLVVLALIAQSARSRDASRIVPAIIMGLAFIAAHVIWNLSAMPIAAQSIKNVSVAALLLCLTPIFPRWQIFAAAGLHLAIVAFGFAADNGLVFEGRRPMQFIAWSYPDVSAGLQHAALMVLSLGTRQHENASLEHDPGYGCFRGVFGVAALALRSREKDASS